MTAGDGVASGITAACTGHRVAHTRSEERLCYTADYLPHCRFLGCRLDPDCAIANSLDQWTRSRVKGNRTRKDHLGKRDFAICRAGVPQYCGASVFGLNRVWADMAGREILPPASIIVLQIGEVVFIHILEGVSDTIVSCCVGLMVLLIVLVLQTVHVKSVFLVPSENVHRSLTSRVDTPLLQSPTSASKDAYEDQKPSQSCIEVYLSRTLAKERRRSLVLSGSLKEYILTVHQQDDQRRLCGERTH